MTSVLNSIVIMSKMHWHRINWKILKWIRNITIGYAIWPIIKVSPCPSWWIIFAFNKRTFIYSAEYTLSNGCLLLLFRKCNKWFEPKLGRFSTNHFGITSILNPKSCTNWQFNNQKLKRVSNYGLHHTFFQCAAWAKLS